MTEYHVLFLDRRGRTTGEHTANVARLGDVFDLLVKIEWPPDTLGFCLLDFSGDEFHSEFTAYEQLYSEAECAAA